MSAVLDITKANWLDVLRAECTKPGSSQKKVAYHISYSPAVINQALKGTYKGSLTMVEQAVRGAYMKAIVACPVYGELEAHRCIEYQRRPYASTNPVRVRLYRACRSCNHNQQQY